jgi:hypothetical protein
MNNNRIIHHQILANLPECKWVKITVDGKRIKLRQEKERNYSKIVPLIANYF